MKVIYVYVTLFMPLVTVGVLPFACIGAVELWGLLSETSRPLEFVHRCTRLSAFVSTPFRFAKAYGKPALLWALRDFAETRLKTHPTRFGPRLPKDSRELAAESCSSSRSFRAANNSALALAEKTKIRSSFWDYFQAKELPHDGKAWALGGRGGGSGDSASC